MIKEVIDEVRETHPFFKAKLIFCGLKTLGNRHIQKVFSQIQDLSKNKDPLLDLIAGFDAIGDEENSPGLRKFARSLVANQQLTKLSGGKAVPFYLHCGETVNRKYHNI